MKRFVVQKVDLDTALTALLLGFGEGDAAAFRPAGATADELADPAILCIESGGSGDVKRGNYDHHDPFRDLPPACAQAWAVVRAEGHVPCQKTQRLVDYVSLLDTEGRAALAAKSTPAGADAPPLSWIFSGMLASIARPEEQLVAAVAILRTVLERGIDPFGVMPDLPEWRGYVCKKAEIARALRMAVEAARFFHTRRGLACGFLSTPVWGALGALYDRGCQIAIAHAPGPVPGTSKYTIGGDRGLHVSPLLAALDEREPGWGGPSHGTIIGSPRGGSRLAPDAICRLVQEVL